MSKKKTHIAEEDNANIITQDELVALVENICQNSINGSVDIIFRMREVYAQYHASTKDKLFAYDTNMPSVPFAQVITMDVEQKIELILRTNLSGQIAESLDITRSLWNDGVFTTIHVIEPDHQDYYRTRISDAPLTKAREMFHTPFELRGLVKTARFSVLGFPSLYLTKNMFTSWEETRRSPIETLYASRLQVKQKITLLDLRLRRSFANISTEERESAAKSYLRMIPLIIACSLKVKRDTDSFKPEYILPQLILHAVIDEMIRRSQLHRLKADNIKYVDSILEIADELTETLLSAYGEDKKEMLNDIAKWDHSYSVDWSKEKVAAKLLWAMSLAKYHEEETTDGKKRMADADWKHYECNKGIRKFAEDGFDGIIYSSTRFDHAYWGKEDINSDCLVIPVHSLRNFGFCNYLRAIFDISEPVGFKSEYFKSINNKGSEKKEYIHSYFGLLEQELKQKPLTHIANFYGTPIQREKAEYQKVFNEQIIALKSLCQLFDEGSYFFAPLIAITLCNLLNNNDGCSLWHLTQGDGNVFADSAFDRTGIPHHFSVRSEDPSRLPNQVIEQSNEEYDGLIRKEINENGEYNLFPLLDSAEQIKWKSFDSWYNQPIHAFRDVTLNRKQIIESVAESEGNLSRSLPDYYALFRDSKSLRVRVNGKDIVFNQNPVYVSLRQIAWEVLESLKRNRDKE